MYKKILVPLDGSELAETVLPHVKQLARCTGAEVILLHVVTMPLYAFVPGDPTLLGATEAELFAEGRRYLGEIEALLKKEGLLVRLEVGEGTVAQAIAESAVQLNVDLIAMSTHGRGGLARLVMGSVADQVVRGAQVPVLLVRPQPIKAKVAESAQQEFALAQSSSSI